MGQSSDASGLATGEDGVWGDAEQRPAGLVDDGLDAQDAAVLVVHLDPVALGPMLDASSLDSMLEIADDLSLEGAVKLAPEKAHHVIGLERKGGMAQKGRIEPIQVRPA